ncbi:uncharacterized protein [Triticum aestivum]|uniref:uncharacterized protein n=1 Tax=Triticum aestivum TaxID=4565 RepID=UPI0008425408|nr:uncharacterized protein LOC123106221 [Triticum aestivum]
MEAAAAAASAAAAAAKDAALAASVAAAAAAKDAAAAAVTAKEAAVAASAAALNAKEAAVRASAAALDAEEAAAVAATAAQAATAAAAAMRASQKRRFADVAEEAAPGAATAGQAAGAINAEVAAPVAATQKSRFADAELDAEEAAPVLVTARQTMGAINADEAVPVAETAGQAATAAAAAMLMQASQKRRFVDAALDAKEAAPAAATAGQAVGPINAEDAAPLAVATQASKKRKSAAAMVTAVEATAVPLQASNKCKFQIIDVDQDPQGSTDVDDAGSVDHIGRLPDAVLCSILSLLPTKEGARTQVISRRWRPLWRSAPLNLVVDEELNSSNNSLVNLISKRDDLISKILSVHPGPARRFSLCLSNSNYHGKMKGWLSSQALDKLREFQLIPKHWFDVRDTFYLLPSSVYRFAPTLRVAKFGGCSFSDLIVKLSLKFPCLKQLTLDRVAISEDALQSMLSGCYALESLELKKNSGFRRLCISSQTLKSVGFCTNWCTESVPLQELVIEDAPCLERLLPLDPQVGPRTIRVISAPKLNILGTLSRGIKELQLGTTVF